MATLARLDFDSLTDGADLTVPSPWAITGTAQMTVSTQAAVHGANGCRLENMEQYELVQHPAPLTEFTALSLYMRIRATGDNHLYFAAARNGSMTANVRINTDLTVSVRDGFIAQATSLETLEEGSVYRMVFGLYPNTATQELRVYKGENVTPLFTLPANWTGGGDLVQWGAIAASPGWTVDFDTVTLSDAWPQPENPETTRQIVVRRWNATNSAWE